ncbi:hypothetical protein LCGC14_1825300, partial [marine sediment metagenome]
PTTTTLMQFQSLLDPTRLIPIDSLGSVRGVASTGLVGCDHCPLDGKPKVMDAIEGRKIFVWTHAPGVKEEERVHNLVGSAGKLLWRELNREGIHRVDCDVHAVVRCRPTTDGRDRIPTDIESQCCSVFTQRALKKSRAHVHLVLGDFAARKLLGAEYRKDRVTFWSSRLNAHVVQTCHPNQLLRDPPIELRREFRRALGAVAILQNCKSEFSILDFFDYREIKNARALKRHLSKLAASGGRIAVDIEDSRGWAKRRDRLLCIAFCGEPGTARVVFLDHPQRVLTKTEYGARVEVLREFLEDDSIEKIFHHGNHDVNGLRELAGINTKGYTYDTEYAAYLVDPNQRKYGLQYLSNNLVPEFGGYKNLPARYAKKRDLAVTTTMGAGEKQTSLDYSTVPANLLGKYCCGDVDLSKRVELLTKKHISLPLLQVFIHCGFMIDKMEDNGPYFDFKFYKQIEEHLPTMIRRLRTQIRDHVDRPAFNPSSPKQVGWLIYDHLGLPLTENRKKKAGTRETGSKILEQLKVRHPVLSEILEYRRLTKLQGTYLTGYHVCAQRYEGRVKTKWWLTGTITGRLRSGGGDRDVVNLQNIANDPLAQNLLVSDRRWKTIEKELARGEDPKRVLTSYGDIKVFLAFDYSGIEVRILAEITGDPALLALFNRGDDIHSLVGEELTGIPAEKIKHDKKTRVMIKGLHFGLIYGQSPEQMYENLKAQFIKMKIPKLEWPTLADLKEFQRKYFLKFRYVKKYIDRMHGKAERDNYVETMFGFRRPIWAGGNDDQRGTFWKNQAQNSPIQGSAHQLLLMCMAILHRKPKTYHLLQGLTLEIHDSMYFYVPLNRLVEAYKMAKDLMEHEVARYIERFFKIKLRVPLVSEAEAGF